MREVLTTIGELVGAALVAIGFGMLAPWIGVVIAGAFIIGLCFVASL